MFKILQILQLLFSTFSIFEGVMMLLLLLLLLRIVVSVVSVVSVGNVSGQSWPQVRQWQKKVISQQFTVISQRQAISYQSPAQGKCKWMRLLSCVSLPHPRPLSRPLSTARRGEQDVVAPMNRIAEVEGIRVNICQNIWSLFGGVGVNHFKGEGLLRRLSNR